MGKPIEYNATVAERIDFTDKLALFRVKPDAAWGPDGNGLIPDFEPGQYTVLGLNNLTAPEKGSVQRAYSIASPPEEKRWIEFYIRYVDEPASDNPLTHLLWQIKNGDRILLGKKITGHFTVAKSIGNDDPRMKICVAAGTGLAPFYCMAQSRAARGLPLKDIAILHGARATDELGYRDELTEMFSACPGNYVPTVSRPHLCPGWTGKCGRVETLFDDGKLETLEEDLGFAPGELNPQNAVVYICGLVGTIRQTILKLLRRGFVPNDRTIRKGLNLLEDAPSLFFEQYDDTPILDMSDPDQVRALLADTPFAGRVA